MKVQTDRYNWSVPVPLDSDYAVGLFLAACVLLAAAGFYSGVHRDALSANPARIFSAVIAAAARRGEATFWVVWGLIGTAGVMSFTAAIICIGLLTYGN